jgi:hypothetical protein
VTCKAARLLNAGASHPDAELFALRDQMSALMDRKSAVDEQAELRYRQMSDLCRQHESTSEALRLAYDESGHDAAVREQNALSRTPSNPPVRAADSERV